MAESAAAAAARGGGPKATMAVFGSLCVGTFGLGCWQTSRYFDKVEMMKVREEELAIVASSSDLPSSSSDSCFRRYELRGTFRHEDEIWLGPRGPPPGAMAADGPNSGRSSGGMSSSPQGYFVITPLELQQQKRVVLVNRGWVPLQHVKQKIAWNRPRNTVNITGTISSTEQPSKWIAPPATSAKEPRHFIWMDRPVMEKQTNTESHDPLLITEIAASSSLSQDTNFTFPVKPKSSTVGEYKVLPPTHAAYAFTWFGLSGAGVLMTRNLLNRLKK